MFAVEFVTARPANAPAYYGLCAPGVYNVGRSSECHIALSSADISRHHATVRVVLRDHMHEVLSTEALQNLAAAFDEARRQDGDDGEPFITPVVVIVENHSQFGCQVDNVRLAQVGATAAITSGGGNVHIGSIVLRLTYRPVLVAVNTETFARDFCDELAVMYGKLGAELCAAGPQPAHGQVYHAVDSECRRAAATFLPGHRRTLDPQPLPHVVNFGAAPIAKFLVTGAIDASPQCLLGLALGYTLVHPSFVFEFFAALAESCVAPMNNAPHPAKYEPAISRLVFPTGGYVRPEGRSLPFPLFPPSLATPWYRSRHRLLASCVVAFRDSAVASALLECVAAMGAHVVPFGDPEQTRARGPLNGRAGGGAGEFVDSDGDDEDDDDGNSSTTDVPEPIVNNTSLGNSNSQSNTPGAIGGGMTPQAQSEYGRQSGRTVLTRRRGWSQSGAAGQIRGARDSDVDSATGDPLLLPHQITKRQQLIEKRKKEVQEKMEETLREQAGREQTLDAKALRGGGGGAGAALAGGADSPDGGKGAATRRKIVLLSPAEVAALAESAAGLADVSSYPFDEQQQHAVALQEDVLAYARHGWDVIACEELLRALLSCDAVGPSLLESLVAGGAAAIAAAEAPPSAAMAGSGSGLTRSKSGGLASNDGAASQARLTEQALQKLQREHSGSSNNLLSRGPSGLAPPGAGAARHGTGSGGLARKLPPGGGDFAGVVVGAEQFTEPGRSEGGGAGDGDSDRTPSDLDDTEAEAMLRAMQSNKSTAGTVIMLANNSRTQARFEESLGLALQLDQVKATMLSRLRRACERNVLAYRARLLQLKKLRHRSGAQPLDVDKLSVARDALLSCEHFLADLEAAERELRDQDRRRDAQRRRDIEEGVISDPAELRAAAQAAANDGAAPWAGAVEPLRDCAVEVAQLAFGIIKKDRPELVAGMMAGRQAQALSSTGEYYEPPAKGRGGFNGVVHEWERPNMRPGEKMLVASAVRQQQQQQHFDVAGAAPPAAADPSSDGGLGLFPEFGGGVDMMTDADRRILQEQQAKRAAAAAAAVEADIHPLTNWVRYSPDIPVQARDDRKPGLPQGIAVAPNHAAAQMGRSAGGGRNQSAAYSSVRGSDLQGIANFRRSLMMQHGDKEGALRFELWLGSQTAQWTTRFHAELERRDLRFSEWLSSGVVMLSGDKEKLEEEERRQRGEAKQQQRA